MSLEERQKEWYDSRDNYLIEYSDSAKSTVAIYFCSNNLFYPHTLEAFEKYVVKTDRYEWYGLRVKRAAKHIFVRDVYKQWYASGLNSRIPNVDSLLLFLKHECEGYKEIVAVGSSAGGYASTLFGTMLNANICFNFNGQWELFSSVEKNGKIISPVLHRILKQGEARYMDIAKPKYDVDSVFYFMSSKSPWDIKQNDHAKGMKRIYRICFNTKHHGIPFLKCSLEELLQYDKKQLKEMSGKSYNPILFSCKISGVWKVTQFLLKEIKKRLQRC